MPKATAQAPTTAPDSGRPKRPQTDTPADRRAVVALTASVKASGDSLTRLRRVRGELVAPRVGATL